MIRPPPRSTLFPTRRSSDLGALSVRINDRPGLSLGRPGEVRRNIVITRESLPSLVEDAGPRRTARSEEHTSELQSRRDLVCRLLLEKKKNKHSDPPAAQSGS